MSNIRILWLLLAFLPFSLPAAQSDSGSFDLLIRNGRLIDGTGNPWVYSDVAVRGDRIVAVGNLKQATAKTVIDAKDKVVSPGFIDMHSHASWNYLVDTRAASKLTQGITLEIEGEGWSVAPLNERMVAKRRAEYQRFGVDPSWRTLGEFFALIEQKPATVNFATYIGTGTVRELVVGELDRPATPVQLEQMRAVVEQAMREGALGIYSALMYVPDRFNRTDELIELAKVAAAHGGVYQTHPRSQSDDSEASMQEMLRIAREARIPAHLTHIKLAYQQNWGRMPQVIQQIEQARANGLDVTADMYPYQRGAGSFTPLLPPWAQEGGREAIVKRLRNAKDRARIKEEFVRPGIGWENEYYGVGGGPAGITLIDALGNPELRPYEGLTLPDIATRMGKDPRDAVLDIILAGDAQLSVVVADEQDIRTAIQVPWIAFGTDAASVAADGPLSEGGVHPRTYGTFPRILGRYVRELKLVSLEDAIRRATSLPAQRLSIPKRGLIRHGYYADIVVFDPATIIDVADDKEPHRYSKGVDYVVVNGQLVLDRGVITEARPGRVVRGPGYRTK